MNPSVSNIDNLLPSVLNLELTNACNLECVFCDHHILKKSMAIKELDCNLLEKILANISNLRIYELGLVGLGEPLLDKSLDKHLHIITLYRKNFERISINTNAVTLDIDKSLMICKSAINFITFSLNATNRNSYLKLMRKDKYDVVLKNIKMFLKIRKDHKRNDLKVNIQIMPLNSNETQTIKEALFDNVYGNVFIFVRDVYNKPTLKGSDYFKTATGNVSQRYPCWSIFSRIYIDVDGFFYPCTIGNDCYREKSNLMIGNVKNDSVIELFNSYPLIAARRRAMESELPFPECSTCNVWELLPNNFKWDARKNVWVNNRLQVRLKQYCLESSGVV